MIALLHLLVYASAQELRFSGTGKFKIVQFTDCHTLPGDARSARVEECVNKVLDCEKPNLVIFTGDIVTGKPADEGLRKVLELVSKRDIPFAFTFGNHDDEQGLSRMELFNAIKEIPHNLTSTTPGLHGVTNYLLPIKSHDGRSTARVLYIFDSGSYNAIKEVGGYDYIHADQIEWYRQASSRFTRENGDSALPSLAFFHIPLPEYAQAASNERAVLIGSRKEHSCPPDLNSGLFTSFKEMGDVQGVFVGHDHDDDYAVMWQGILLAYGRFSGGNTVYNNLPSCGARVIELDEALKGFTTWIRNLDGSTELHLTFPNSFLRLSK